MAGISCGPKNFPLLFGVHFACSVVQLQGEHKSHALERHYDSLGFCALRAGVTREAPRMLPADWPDQA
jgi:hypothetical protein